MATILKYKDPGTGQWIPIVPAGPPIGAIIWWPTSSPLPSGWLLCDGTAHNSSALLSLLGSSYTPDLRNRFIVGAGSSYARGATGGVELVTLTSAQSGVQSHSHSASIGANDRNHTHPLSLSTGGGHTHGTDFTSHYIEPTDLSNDTGDGYVLLQNPHTAHPNEDAEDAAGAHTHSGATGGVTHDHAHTITIGTSTAANASASHENMPPYYVLAYIIRGA